MMHSSLAALVSGHAQQIFIFGFLPGAAAALPHPPPAAAAGAASLAPPAPMANRLGTG
eukprot:CAMPEP_0115716108 /NCGR_PEP_ID=MMETSP0272-20121206/76154_1 /TAXON_ID=71861 /ORGANISM="Scrippsiella trochoidea, Strain CCMP3099" /LENGTH=57 /DNA_ID=CAMNT_0003158413 /DNA_START=37 /DNA_END=206 /DNA_ORIENTATION=-